MEADRWPERMWVVSHKPVAVAAGLGMMGIHRNVIHPKFGNFILLGTVLLESAVSEYSQPTSYNPCLECKLCVAACPVGAIKPDGQFDMASCYTHNYREFMGGFGDWAEHIADASNGKDLRTRVSPAEQVSMWQSLAFSPNYKSGYCIAVCPAGEDVIGPFLANQGAFMNEVLKPLQQNTEPVYVVPNSDAEGHVIKRFPHKRVERVRGSLLPATIGGFLFGMHSYISTRAIGRSERRLPLQIHGIGIRQRNGDDPRQDHPCAAGTDGHRGLRDHRRRRHLAGLLAERKEHPLGHRAAESEGQGRGEPARRIRPLFPHVAIQTVHRTFTVTFFADPRRLGIASDGCRVPSSWNESAFRRFAGTPAAITSPTCEPIEEAVMNRTAAFAVVAVMLASSSCFGQYGGVGGMGGGMAGGMGGQGMGSGMMMQGGRLASAGVIEIRRAAQVEMDGGQHLSGKIDLRTIVVDGDLGRYMIAPAKIKAIRFLKPVDGAKPGNEPAANNNNGDANAGNDEVVGRGGRQTRPAILRQSRRWRVRWRGHARGDPRQGDHHDRQGSRRNDSSTGRLPAGTRLRHTFPAPEKLRSITFEDFRREDKPGNARSASPRRRERPRPGRARSRGK